MRITLFVSVLAASLIAGASPVLQTVLTDVGNREAVALYKQFMKAHEGCKASVEGPRVILTGFGLFDGLKYNISGAMIANLSDTAFWPEDVEPDAAYQVPEHFPIENGVLRVSDRGGTLVNRVFKIGGRAVNVCLLNLDVTWDFAAAVIVREMIRFQPAVVLMTGVNGSNSASIEAGALNTATKYAGYYPDGSYNDWATPQRDFVLPNDARGLEVPMTFEVRRMGEAIAPLMTAMEHPLVVNEKARPSNIYICNNVSYVALRAAANRRLELAGGRLVFEPRIISNPKVGFFHLPLRETSGPLEPARAGAWARVLLTMIRANL